MAINVIDFGAVGDGTTPNIAAFRAAHDALPANGGTIIIPAGTYRLEETWTITKPVILLGESPPNMRGGAHGSLLYFDNGITGINLPSSLGSDASTSQISNLYVISRSNGQPQRGDGIVIGVHGVIIRDCAFAYFGRYGILVGDGTPNNNANNTLIEATRCEFNGSDGFHLYATSGGCGVSTFINIDCSANKGWGFWHEGGVKNTFLTAHADSNTLGAFHEAGNSTAWINCYSEGATEELPLSNQFEVPDGVIGLFCVAGDYGAPKFTGGPNALNSPGNIIIAPARGYPTRWALSVALTLGRDGSTGSLEIIGGSSAANSLSDWFLEGAGTPDRALQIFNQLSFRAALYITGGNDAAANDRVGIGSTTPQAKLHVRPHVPGLDALRVEDNTGTVKVRVGAGVGFYGTAPVPQPIVTGSRSGNSALVLSLLSALATLGLITDNTTP